MGWAEVLGAEAIVLGVNALDYSGYPDCRPEYLGAFEQLAALATRAGVEGRSLRILAPLLHRSKAEIITRGLELGLRYGLTLSCYDPGPTGTPCGALRQLPPARPRLCDGRRNRSRAPSRHRATVTTRLYYTDPYLTAFDAEVQRVETLDGRPAAVLDRTAFYPASGGQPSDTGRLGAATVVEVTDREDGAILHVLDRSLDAGPVHGQIDWARRFDHMQQHTGQHLLSAAFDRLFQVRTESFHMGPATATIDLARVVAAKEIEAAEDEANRVDLGGSADRHQVRRRRRGGGAAAAESVRAWRPAPDHRDRGLRCLGMRRDPRREDRRRSGSSPSAASERFRGGTRLEFICGGRALGAFRAQRDAVAASVQLVSVLPAELPAAIERLQAEAKESRRLLKDARGRLAGFEAEALAAGAVRRGGVLAVVASLAGWDQAGLKSIAAAVVSRPSHVAVLFSAPPPAAVIVARAADASFDCAAAMAALVGAFGGKGGGRPDLAQGGGLQGSPEAMVSFASGLFQ